MKKIFLLIFISLCFCQNIAFCANTTQKADITKIENNIFGYDYNNEKMEARLARLEKSIYGKVSSGNNETRLKKIINDIAANEIGSEIKPSEDTYKEKEELADSSVQYPYVDEIEQKLFNKTYGNRDFHTRIVTIERKLFGKIYDVDDYATRMERIKAKMEPNSHLANKSRNYSETENIAEISEDVNSIEIKISIKKCSEILTEVDLDLVNQLGGEERLEFNMTYIKDGSKYVWNVYGL